MHTVEYLHRRIASLNSTESNKGHKKKKESKKKDEKKNEACPPDKRYEIVDKWFDKKLFDRNHLSALHVQTQLDLAPELVDNYLSIIQEWFDVRVHRNPSAEKIFVFDTAFYHLVDNSKFYYYLLSLFLVFLL
jgi:hypothetical protein